jgi:hypothetical protein
MMRLHQSREWLPASARRVWLPASAQKSVASGFSRKINAGDSLPRKGRSHTFCIRILH